MGRPGVVRGQDHYMACPEVLLELSENEDVFNPFIPLYTENNEIDRVHLISTMHFRSFYEDHVRKRQRAASVRAQEATLEESLRSNPTLLKTLAVEEAGRKPAYGQGPGRLRTRVLKHCSSAAEAERRDAAGGEGRGHEEGKKPRHPRGERAVDLRDTRRCFSEMRSLPTECLNNDHVLWNGVYLGDFCIAYLQATSGKGGDRRKKEAKNSRGAASGPPLPAEDADASPADGSGSVAATKGVAEEDRGEATPDPAAPKRPRTARLPKKDSDNGSEGTSPASSLAQASATRRPAGGVGTKRKRASSEKFF